MKEVAIALALCLAVFPAYAQKGCEELKSKIEKKIDSKGVKNFQLVIVPADQAKDIRVVGSCEAGKEKIVYKRT